MATHNGNNNVPAVDFISAVADIHENWSLLVRVVRMWRVPDINGNKLPFSLELVLLDSEGSKIQASVKKQLLYKYEKDITEGSVYYMTKFGVTPNIGEYRATRHPFKLNFNIWTKIRKTNDMLVPAHVYTFTPPANCFLPEFENDYLVDIIGVLTGVSQHREYIRNGIKSKLITVELDNMGYRFKVTLFGNFVDELQSFMSAGDILNAVIVVLFSKVKNWQGRVTIQSTMHSSKLLINPDLPEVVALRNNVAENQDSPNPGLSQIKEAKIADAEDDFIYQTPATTIASLKDYKEAGMFVLCATVTNVADDGDWWYSACRCTKKVYADENAYFCERCNRHVFTVTPRYLLKLKVNDETGSGTFVLFENEAASLINKSCADLLETLENPNPFGFPREIAALIGKNYLFKVQCVVSETRFERTFRVKRVSGDADILQKFKDKHKDGNDVTINSKSGMVALGAEFAAGVAQDLMNKFGESSGKGKAIYTQHEVVDLEAYSEESPVMKKSCPNMEEGGPSHIILKEIKKEKE